MLLLVRKEIINKKYIEFANNLSFLTAIYFYYQQPGEAKNPYFAQYSAVVQDTPVRVMD